MERELINSLRELLSEEQVKEEEPLMRYTTFRIGGPAELLVTVYTPAQLEMAVRLLKAAGHEPVIIGNGSNLLVSDDGVRGAVVRFAATCGDEPEILYEDEQTVTVRVSGGAMLSGFAKEMTNRGFTGLEFAAGIPGSVGGAVFMNAGAYGGEIKDVITSAVILDRKGNRRTVEAGELELSYRHSALTDNGAMVLSAAFTLNRGDAEEGRAKIAELLKKRKEKQPLEYPSAGSTFKRPEGYFAGKLIEDAGLSGYSVGGARVSEKHCGFVINGGNATALDVLRLITEVRKRVYAMSSVWLTPEVRFLGDFSRLPEDADRELVKPAGA